MKKALSIILIVLVMIPSMAMAATETNYTPNEDILFFEEVLRYIEEKYPFKIEERTLIDGALKGMLQSVDPYSDYYTIEESGAIFESLMGTFSGIGIYIEEKDGYIKIQDTIKSQPAEKAGLKKNDLIVKIDGKDIKNMGLQEASSMIKGPVGTKVDLEIKRGNQFLKFQVSRENISESTVEYNIFDDIGYIRIKEFNDNTTNSTMDVLKEFENKEIEKIILDLRNNPGGILGQSINISGLFVPKGPVVHIREANKGLLTHASTLEHPNYELVALINENSASAAEIVAGAIRDREAGKLVGKKTYGKGTVQSYMPLADGSIIKLTIAEYLTPNKISINGEGIEPDYPVENIGEEDLQLKKALELLR